MNIGAIQRAVDNNSDKLKEGLEYTVKMIEYSEKLFACTTQLLEVVDDARERE